MAPMEVSEGEVGCVLKAGAAGPSAVDSVLLAKSMGSCNSSQQQGSNQSSIRIQSHHNTASGTIASARTARL